MCYYSQVNGKIFILSQLLKLTITSVKKSSLLKKGKEKTKKEIREVLMRLGNIILSGIQFQFKAERTLSLKILGDLVKIPED